MYLERFYDDDLAQASYLIGSDETGEAVVVDPRRDAGAYLAAAAAKGLRIVAVTETHVHADYLSGARELAQAAGADLYLSAEGGPEWRYRFDHRPLHDGDVIEVGEVTLTALHTPGHTPEHLSFLVTDHGGGASEPMGIASGDFVFVGDLGRPDLLETAAGQEAAKEPAARDLFASVQKVRDLPEFLQVWPGHGAGSACGKALGAVPQSTFGYEWRHNRAIQTAKEGEEPFVKEILEGQPEPPLYFARMKRLNRDGVPPLGDPGSSPGQALPQPETLGASDLDDLADNPDVTVIDTRERGAYMRGHLAGSLLAPFDSSFTTTVGSYVEPDEPVYLVIAEEDAEQAVRDLVRIGLDDVRGIIPPDALAEYGRGNDRLRMLKTIDFDELDGRRHYTNVEVLDVRRQDEWDRKHIPGARHVPHVRLAEHLDALPRDKTLLVHCQSGVRSAVAAALLDARGFCVAYVDDEFDNWKEREKEEGVAAGAH